MLLMVPEDLTPYPSLGEQLCDFIEKNMVFGPGDLRGKPGEDRANIPRQLEVAQGPLGDDNQPASHPPGIERLTPSLVLRDGKRGWVG